MLVSVIVKGNAGCHSVTVRITQNTYNTRTEKCRTLTYV